MLWASSPSQLRVVCKQNSGESQQQQPQKTGTRTCDGEVATQQAQASQRSQQQVHGGGWVAVTETKHNNRNEPSSEDQTFREHDHGQV
jgi:hypothetical protein